MPRERTQTALQRVIADLKAQLNEVIRDNARLRVRLRKYEPGGEPCEPSSDESSA